MSGQIKSKKTKHSLIVSSGFLTGSRYVPSEEVDRTFRMPVGKLRNRAGIESLAYAADGENELTLGARAAEEALRAASLFGRWLCDAPAESAIVDAAREAVWSFAGSVSSYLPQGGQPWVFDVRCGALCGVAKCSERRSSSAQADLSCLVGAGTVVWRRLAYACVAKC